MRHMVPCNSFLCLTGRPMGFIGKRTVSCGPAGKSHVLERKSGSDLLVNNRSFNNLTEAENLR